MDPSWLASRPDLTSIGSSRTRASVPARLTSLLAREREVTEVAVILARPEVRLLTLTGPGGVGKTRLAIAVATAVETTFRDGVAFVELAPIRDAGMIASAIGHALGVRESSGQLPVPSVIAALGSAELLLVLDNFEHVLTAAPLVVDLLLGCPNLTVLCTSRATLRLSGEHEFPVAPLALPDPETRSFQHIANAPAVRLYAERAAAVEPGFQLTEANATAVAAICTRLDGLPLAIELAASRAKVLPPQALLPRLARQLPLLSGGPRDVPARLQTMRDAISWSYQLLAPSEQVLFRRLAVFAGGFDLDAAEAICAEVVRRKSGRRVLIETFDTVQDHATEDDVLSEIAGLQEKSLLQRQDVQGGQQRFRMLETVREFAGELLQDSADEAVTRTAHAAYFLMLAEHAAPYLSGRDQLRWLARLESELPNFRAALRWLRETRQDDAGSRLATALLWFWYRRNLDGEGRSWLEGFLESSHVGDAALRVRALTAAAILATRLGDHDGSLRLSGHAIELSRNIDDRSGLAIALRTRGVAAVSAGQLAQANVALAECQTILLDEERPWDAAVVYQWLAIAAYAAGDYAAPIGKFMRAMELFERAGDSDFATWMWGNIGWVSLIRHDYPRAKEAFSQSLAHSWDSGDLWQIAWSLMGIGGLAVRQGSSEVAARLFGAADALRVATGGPLIPSVQFKYDEMAAAAKAKMGVDRWRETKTVGATLPLAAIVDEAHKFLGEQIPEHRAPAGREVPFGLTQREIDVLGRLVAGMTDREIAGELFISVKTAHNHVSHVLAKLGVANRTEAAAMAIRDGVVSPLSSDRERPGRLLASPAEK